MLQEYINRISNVARQGDAREESFYSSLETLLSEVAVLKGIEDFHVTSQPKKTEAGNPDFRLWHGKQRIVGYIEAKLPRQDLNSIEKTDQIIRYKNVFPNFILTNFLEFRLYRNGSLIDNVKICDPMSIYDIRLKPSWENETDLDTLLEKFFSFSFPSITSAQPLAVELAKRTRFLRDEVIAEELREQESESKRILGFYEAFQKYLIRGLTKEQFADLYSQTVTYGLFASRMRCQGDFNRRLAVDDIPSSIGILKEMFEFISLGKLPIQFEWVVDEISNVLASVDVNKIFSEFYSDKKGRDPIFHFYETFLAEYDPEEREKRGVYYTPEPVVSYIVRSLDVILKEDFALEDGLASGKVTILDPAAGTLTFLAESIRQATTEFTSRYGDGAKIDLIRKHILQNFYAFELMIAPYAIGHLKISLLLDKLGYKLQENERVKFYLTNTLELEEIEQTSLPGMVSLSEESRKAGEVKKKIPILVVLGNPPYSGISANKGEWISKLIEDYKFVDGKSLGERNPKWLQDDYVKFIRFAEWKINQLERGIVGYITNHSYLDNPTFRGMRQHLVKSFDKIYVLDLHGNALKRERCPDGSKDENVFDIRQGVSIAFFERQGKDGEHSGCKVFHAEIWGARDEKYKRLSSEDKRTTSWKEIQPHSPFYFFVPREESLLGIYEKYPKITEIFPFYGVGMTSARDGFVISMSSKTLIERIISFKNSHFPDDQLHEVFQINEKKGWSIRKAWNMLQEISDDDVINYVLPVLYRPFDVRWIFYHDSVVWRTVKRIMQHMRTDNLAMCVGRAGQVVGLEKPWNVVFCSEFMEDFNLFYRGGSANFPLYLLGRDDKKPNIEKQFYKRLQTAYNHVVSPEDIFCYVYSILYSNAYRTKYMEFLKTDFPRIPFTTRYEQFSKLSGLGRQLVDLHLLKSPELTDQSVKFQGEGNCSIEKVLLDSGTSRLYINKNQYFEKIEKELWDYQIGGYQVLFQWLKYRRNLVLSFEDIKHFCKIITAIKKTVEVQDKIDELYLKIEKNVLGLRIGKQKACLDKYKNE